MVRQKSHSPAFKAKAALAAFSGEKTIEESERLRRSLKYERARLHVFETGSGRTAALADSPRARAVNKYF